MVIEDEYFLADDMVRLLRGYGAEVVGPVGEVRDAFEILHSSDPPDIAVLDINLKGELIFPVADELRSRDIPFIFVSGYDERPIPEEYRDVQLLEKPVDDATIRQALGNLARAL